MVRTGKRRATRISKLWTGVRTRSSRSSCATHLSRLPSSARRSAPTISSGSSIASLRQPGHRPAPGVHQGDPGTAEAEAGGGSADLQKTQQGLHKIDLGGE